jgi:glycosyltransferase involved in cell wall biosynthesis
VLVVTAVQPETVVQSQVECVTRDHIAGWAWDAARPDAALAIQILDNGVPIARVLANFYRPDLARAGIGDGRHSFDIRIPGGLAPLERHVIQIKHERDGADLTGSPVVIEPASSFDPALERAIAQAITATDTRHDREHVLHFMLAQTDRLLQTNAEADGRHAERLADRQLRRAGNFGRPRSSTAANPGLRALVVDERTPIARRDAGSQALLSHMRALQRLGYAVSFVAADEIAPSEAATTELTAAGIMCYGPPFYASVEEVLRRQAGCLDVVYLHRASVAARYLAMARRYDPAARIVYSVADLHHIRLERQATIEERPESRIASRQMRLAELTAAWSADAVITHSTEEAELLRRTVPEANVHRVPWEIEAHPTKTAFERRRGVAFIGCYDHAPNRDAAHWLVQTVMPLVWQIDPAVTCLLVGSDMPPSIRDLAQPGIVPIGHVHDLAADVFSQVRLTVAPLRYGAGVKGKVLDSMAAGVPCVMSEVAAEGLTLPPALQDLVGRTAKALAALICGLHANSGANQSAAAAGLSMIRRDFTSSVLTSALHGALSGLPATPGHEEAVELRITAR